MSSSRKRSRRRSAGNGDDDDDDEQLVVQGQEEDALSDMGAGDRFMASLDDNDTMSAVVVLVTGAR